MEVIKLVGGPLDGRMVELPGELPDVFEARPGPGFEDRLQQLVYFATGVPCPETGLPTYRFGGARTAGISPDDASG